MTSAKRGLADEYLGRMTRRLGAFVRQNRFHPAKLESGVHILQDMVRRAVFLEARDDHEDLMDLVFPASIDIHQNLKVCSQVDPTSLRVSLSLKLMTIDDEQEWPSLLLHTEQAIPPDIWEMLWVRNPQDMALHEIFQCLIDTQATLKLQVKHSGELQLSVFLPWNEYEEDNDADFIATTSFEELDGFLTFDPELHNRLLEEEERERTATLTETIQEDHIHRIEQGEGMDMHTIISGLPFDED